MNKVVYLLLTFLFSHHAHSSIVTVGPAACDYTTIQDAIDNEPTESLSIRVVQGVYDGGITIDTSALDNNQDISLTGNYLNCDHAAANHRTEGAQSTIDGNGTTFGIKVTHSNETSELLLRLTGMRITNGHYVAEVTATGGLQVAGSVTVLMNDTDISESTGIFGGGVYANSNSRLFLKDSMIHQNQAINGGGVFCQNCFFNADTGTGIANNVATQFGGGIYVESEGVIDIYSGSANPQTTQLGIHGNSAEYGGGIYAKHSLIKMEGRLDVINSTPYGDDQNPVSLSHNSALYEGGGVYLTNASSITMNNMNVIANEAGVSGAGIQATDLSLVTINSNPMPQSCWNNNKSQCSRFVNNRIANGSETNGSGGAIRAEDSLLRIRRAWFEGNDAGGEGNGSVLSIVGSDFGSFIESSVIYKNGFITGSDNNVIHTVMASLDAHHITAIDNRFSNSMFFAFGGPIAHFHSFSLLNSIVHNSNGGDVFQLIEPPPTDVSCVMVNEQVTLPDDASFLFEAQPIFFNRDQGLLQLTSASQLAIDKCVPAPMPWPGNIDIVYNDRFIDLPAYHNQYGDLNIADMGAFEYPGFDDLIFNDSFD